MMHPSFRDLADYIGGAGASNEVVVFDNGGRVSKTKDPKFSTMVCSTLSVSGNLSFFGAAAVAQQAAVGTLSGGEINSAYGANSVSVALALASLGSTVNSLALYLRRFGFMV